ncbi:MAG TPA: hypothetical protein GX699_09215 [Firmicutes bacterium]|nr:hypothetical protein [Bacillota bacterium]
MGSDARNKSQVRWAVIITAWTFALAVFLGMVTQYLFAGLKSILLATVNLVIIIFVGILFDMIGIAATAADEVPLLAKAAKKTPGAREALFLIRHADRVSNFCNDVVGDIAGIISGSLGALLVLRLVAGGFFRESPLISIFLTGIISALTVGGKALGKTFAIERSTEIILGVAYLLTKIDAILPGKSIFGTALPRKRK